MLNFKIIYIFQVLRDMQSKKQHILNFEIIILEITYGRTLKRNMKSFNERK